MYFDGHEPIFPHYYDSEHLAQVLAVFTNQIIFHDMRKTNCTVSREWLYDLVWRIPASEVAQQLGVSSSRLHHACKTMEIACPSDGYWMKKNAGKLQPKPKLLNEETGIPSRWKGQDCGTLYCKRSNEEQVIELTAPSYRNYRSITVQLHRTLPHSAYIQ